MSRTFRRKNYSPVKEARFIGWDIVVKTKYGVCSLTEAEQDRIIKRDFNVFHSDAFHLSRNGYWYKLSNKLYRKHFRQALKEAYRRQEEDEFVFKHTYRSMYYGLW